jgi:K(+)-stimulated pyrophosphate-energized sodium pump
MEIIMLLPPIIGVLGLIAAWYTYMQVKKYPEGEGKVVEIGNQIHLGAMVFMKREYKMLSIFSTALIILLYIFLGWGTAFSFLIGALASAGAGYIGMNTATRANVRTTTAAHNEGAAAALTVAFFGGSIMGLSVAALGLLGLGSVYLIFSGDPETLHSIHGFAMGASVVALFSRVGGGIFTKSADVGADLVGKIEAGIPEDDPRNPGVIADNVGDNVGDVAGMGSDIFESYCGSMIATIAITSTLSAAALIDLGSRGELMFLPLALASLGLICSIGGIYIVKVNSAKSPEKALRTGTMGASILFIIAAYFLIAQFDLSAGIWAAVLAGAVGGIIIGLTTEYYTAGKPVEHIAKSGAWKRDPLHNLSHGATALQVARFYYMLQTGRLVSPERSRQMKFILSNPAIEHKFVKGLKSVHPDSRIYRKSGTWQQYHADSAIVEHDGRRYIAVALAKSRQGGKWLSDLIVAMDDLIFKSAPSDISN